LELNSKLVEEEKSKLMKKLLIFLLCSQIAFSQELSSDISTEVSPMVELKLLLNDLANSRTNGYKSHMLEIDYYNLTIEDYLNNMHISRVTRRINFSQGSMQFTNRELDFAIEGDGFFKVIYDDGVVAYTRNGEFMIDDRTNELIMINGMKKARLFETIKIDPGYTQLIFNEDNSIITVYPNGDIVNNGKLYLYVLDTNELSYFNDLLDNNYTFLYNGEEEKLYNGRIYHRFIELSNVERIGTLVRLIVISTELGMELEFNNDE